MIFVMLMKVVPFQDFEGILLYFILVLFKCMALFFTFRSFHNLTGVLYTCVVWTGKLFISEGRANFFTSFTSFVLLPLLLYASFIINKTWVAQWVFFWTVFSVCLIFWSLCETILHYKSLWRILLSAKIGQFLLLLLRLFSFLEDLENQLVKSTVRILIGIRMSNLEVNLRRVDFKCCLNFQKKSKKVHFTHSNTYPSFPLQKLPYAFPHELLVFQGPQRTKCFDRFFFNVKKASFSSRFIKCKHEWVLLIAFLCIYYNYFSPWFITMMIHATRLALLNHTCTFQISPTWSRHLFFSK